MNNILPTAVSTEESITGVDRPSDRELLGRAVTLAKPERGRINQPKWVCVRNVFEVGSTTANLLCSEFGVDPEKLMDGGYCEECPISDDDEESADNG